MVALEREVPDEVGVALEEVPLMDDVPGEVPFASVTPKEVLLAVSENLEEVPSEVAAVPVVEQLVREFP